MNYFLFKNTSLILGDNFPELFRMINEIPFARCIGAYDEGGEVAGVCLLRPSTIIRDAMQISYLYVLGQYREKGIGSEFIRRAKILSQDMGYEKLSIVVDEDSDMRLFRKNGFDSLERTYVEQHYGIADLTESQLFNKLMKNSEMLPELMSLSPESNLLKSQNFPPDKFMPDLNLNEFNPDEVIFAVSRNKVIGVTVVIPDTGNKVLVSNMQIVDTSDLAKTIPSLMLGVIALVKINYPDDTEVVFEFENIGQTEHLKNIMPDSLKTRTVKCISMQ